MKHLQSIFLAAVIAAVVSPSVAQTDDSDRDAEIKDRLSKLHMKIVEGELGLSGNQAAAVREVLDTLAEEHRKIQDDLRDARAALRELRAAGSTDQEAYRAGLDELRRAIGATRDLLERRFDQLDDNLTPEQHTIVIFELARMHRKMRSKMRQRR